MHSRLMVMMVQVMVLAGGLSLAFDSPARAGDEMIDVCRVTGTGTVDGMPRPPYGHITTVAAPAFPRGLAPGDSADFALGTLPDGNQVCGATSWEFVESVTLRADEFSGSASTTVLEASGWYALRVSGRWVNGRDDFLVDAEYSIFQGTVGDGHPPDPADLDANWGDLQINGKFVDWGKYNADHAYWLEMSGTGAAFQFRIYDGDRNGREPPAWYADNRGSLIVEIYETPVKVANCVCPVVQRRVPPAVIADAVAQPGRYYGWLYPLDPNKPASPANPPRTCLSLHQVGLDYHPLWNKPEWRVGCP